MRKHALRLVAAVSVLAGCAVAAAAVSPPAGTPNLARMGLQPSDLPGAKVTRQGYVKPSEGSVAAYERELMGGQIGSTRLFVTESDIWLMKSAADAHAFMTLVPSALRQIDPDDLAASFARGAGFRPKYVRLSKPIKLRVVDEAILAILTIGIETKRLRGEFRTLMVFQRADRVLGIMFTLALPPTKLGAPHATLLARRVSAHIRAGLAPTSSSPPTITGLAQIGQSLTASTGTWQNSPTRFAYQWQRCDATGGNCASIDGATASTYTVQPADGGFTLRVQVTASNAGGSAQATSAITAVVPAPPVNSVLPAITGTPTVGQTLIANPGTWTGAPTFAYQWRRCDTAGANCVDIAGATTQTYTLTPAETGFTIVVAVTATNPSGSATAVSSPTAVVT